MTSFYCQPVAAETITVFFGTYTGGQSKGIYKCHFDLDSGVLSDLQVAAETVNPSFLAIHPTGQYLYAVGEISEFNGQPVGAVSAFKIDPDTQQLTALNQQQSGGAGPCHLIVDRTGKFVLVANYGGGSVSSIVIREDGSLGEQVSFYQHEGSGADPSRQQGPHAHSVNVDAANKFAFVADLGLDKILIYAFDASTGKLKPHDPPFVKVPAGGGPRHFAFHPSGKYAYANNEILLSVNAFRYDAEQGSLTLLQTVGTVPDGTDLAGNSTAETLVHPSGKFVYVSNRGPDSIAVFRVDADLGTLSKVEHEPTGGKTPRNFAIDPTGKWLLAENQGTNDVFVFRINQQTGELDPTGHKLEVPSPVCAKFQAR
jgi:6-phosphogluconolactonase